MERHQNHLLKIYSDTLQLARYKRKLMGGLALGQPPSLNEEDQLRTSSTKLGRCLSKFLSEFKRNVEQLGNDQSKGSHLNLLAKLTQDLSNNRELFTQEEAIIAEIKQLMTHWDSIADPLLHYEQGERQEMRNRLQSKLQELVKWEEVNRSAKKPLYLRKLERELRDNLQKIAEEERSFNLAQQNTSIAVRSRLGKLSGKLIGVIDRMSRESLVNQEKNELLRNYIDIFNDSSHISEKDFETYRNDFGKTLQAIAQIFKQQQSSFLSLTQYVNSLDKFTNQRIKDILASEDQFTVEMKDMNEQIYSIVGFHESVELAHSTKELYAFTREWENAKNRMKKVAETLEEAIVAVRQFTGKSIIRQSRRSNPVEQFIQDKKFMETLVKKEMQFQDGIFEIWRLFFEKYMKALNQQSKAIERSNSKSKGKGRLENAFDRLFISYFQETQTTQRNEVGPTLRHSNKAFIAEAERFIKTITVFTEEVDWAGAYQCSLGPRLLIHGKLKVLPSGIYYESSFNQKNYFFGRTKIFIPKEEIFEINKQTVLVFFPDVLEVVTKYGGVYFHALGKRETMYQNFIDTYLPEVNVQGPREELAFNEFKGDEAAAQQRVEPFMTKLQTELCQFQFENNTLANIFHKYLANQEFYFQGRTYHDYKTYLIQGVQGKNIKSSGFTPGIPYYFQLHNPQIQPKDLQQSERLFTYDKKMPMIPFVSKGGDGVCQEKSVFHWGGPKRLIIDNFTIVSGFSLTEGMVVKSRQVLRQQGSKVKTMVTGEVAFQSNSAMNGMIRGPALSNLKDYHQNGMEKIVKMEKNKPAQPNLNSKKNNQAQEFNMQGQRIRQLQLQLKQAKTRLKQVTIIFAVIYVLTLLLFNILQ